MRYKKTLNELTIKDNFMFGAVMIDVDNCKKFLELILGFPIAHIEVSKEKSIVYHPEYKGVRLDVYAKDLNNTRYNIEMQMVQKPALGKRTSYYHGQIDMELLLKGMEYADLPDTYVIFICDFDPFGLGRYCYTFEERCLEDESAKLNSGSRTIFLSTYGENEHEVSEALVKFLKFVKADLEESTKDFEDDYVKQLQNSVREIKSNREMEGRYMIFEEMLRDERAEGRAEGRAEAKAESLLELLYAYGTVPDTLRQKIIAETNLEVLNDWFKAAIKAKSVEQFMQDIS